MGIIIIKFEVGVMTDLKMPEELEQMSTHLNFAKYQEVYDIEREDTKEFFVNFILQQAEAYYKDLENDK